MLTEALLKAYSWMHDLVFRAGRRRKRLRTAESSKEDVVREEGRLPPSKRLRYDAPESSNRGRFVRRHGESSSLPSCPPLPSGSVEVKERKPKRKWNRERVRQLRATSMANRLPTVEEYIQRYPIKKTWELRQLPAVDLVAEDLDMDKDESLYPHAEAHAEIETIPSEESSMSAEMRGKRMVLTVLEDESEQQHRLIEKWQQVLIDAQQQVRKNEERRRDASSSAIGSSSTSTASPYPENDSRMIGRPTYHLSCRIPPLKRLPSISQGVRRGSALSPEVLRIIAEYLPKKAKAGSGEEGMPAYLPEMLTEEDRSRYRKIDPKSKNGMHFVVDNCSFTNRDVSTLLPREWLNDNVVNGYMKLLQLRDAQLEGGPSCHFCKTFLINHIFPQYNYENVRRWTTEKRLKNWGQTKKCILDCDQIFFPVHQNKSHWVLVVATLKGKELRYYDSLGRRISEISGPVRFLLTSIRQYLVDEAADKLGQTWSVEDFQFEIARDMPQQENGSDCGVYMVRTAKELSGQHALNFTAEEMVQYRMLILKELMRGKLL